MSEKRLSLNLRPIPLISEMHPPITLVADIRDILLKM
jgi:hypothetical protein